ncbi:hypothetical protein ACFQMA_24960 [Halosimplex aquaticum]|uniref:Trypsin-like peptidase domain-containing protein n=1 Tax=Halosimplex aquaticum TaxID=3026162 RepID=A0ABD5Y6L2_9EURY
MDIPRSIREDLESRKNVIGTAIGPKRVGDRPTDEEALVVLVSEKLPETHLAEVDRIPSEIEFDDTRIRTDVQEVGDVRTQATTAQPAEEPDRERRWRPAPAGVSLGHPEITAGTLGSPPLQTEDGKTVVLTNAHVAAPIDTAQPGDNILQPGPADGGSDDDVIGTLVEGSEIRPNEPNTTDSAIVEVDPEQFTGTVLGIGEFAGFTEVSADATFTKSGRTTGVTTGDLRGRDARIKVRGYHDEPTVFEGIDVFGPMSAAGDSGSLIGIDGDDGFRATDLLFAGSDRTTLAIPMDAVEEEHGALAPAGSESGAEDASKQ